MTTQNQTIKKILIAPDKFKGSLTSTQAALAIRRGIEQRSLLSCGSSPAVPAAAPATGAISAPGAGAISALGTTATSAPAAAAIPTRNDLGSTWNDSASAGNISGEICAPERGNVVIGNNLGGICSPECGNDAAGHVSDEICAPEFRIIEIADGGDGSLEVLQKKLPGAEVVPIAVHNPVGKEVTSQILLYQISRAENSTEICSATEKAASRAENSAEICSATEKAASCAENSAEICSATENVVFCAQNSAEFCSEGDSEGEKCGKQCAFIEMAKVSGLEMVAKEERNPLHTSTYGMGEAIRAAIAQGAKEITLSIGGSATNDGGAGMLQALGYKFYDLSGEEMPAPICGGDLCRVATIEAPQRVGEECVKFKVICDVTNPLLGQQGATAVYGPQKGADENALQHLEAGLANYAAVAEKCLSIPQNCKEHPGAGAAGGVGYAGLAFLKAELIPGWKFFAQITSLEESVKWADLVLTGEGSLDSQSLSGKVVSGVVNLAAKYRKPTIIFCGINKLTPDEMAALSCTLPNGVTCYSIASLGYPLEVCMRDAAQLLQQLAKESI